MQKKSKVSASQIYFCVCILAVLTAAFIFAVVAEHAPVFAAFKEKGMAAEATVTGKEIRITQGTSRKGRKTESKSHFLRVSYNGTSVTPHAAAASGKPILPGSNALIISADVRVSTSEYESLAIGAKTMVTYLPQKMFEPRLTASVQDYTPVWQRLTAVILSALGIWTAYMSWTRRVPKTAAPTPG